MSTGLVLLDTNLVLLLVAGHAGQSMIGMHKRLQDYSIDYFEILAELIDNASGVILLPHVLAKTSNLARHIKNPAKSQILSKLAILIETCSEPHMPSLLAVQRPEYDRLGLNDAMVLAL